MLPYNTDMEPVLLPEYGRNLQGLVNYCVQIPDRDERTACAYAIADTMASMFPELVGVGRDYSKIWDQINIMSRFELDIDFPCEVITSEKLHPVPAKIPYSKPDMRFRHYGKNIEKMIQMVAALEDSEEKDLLISMIAHHMKKLMLQHNREASTTPRFCAISPCIPTVRSISTPTNIYSMSSGRFSSRSSITKKRKENEQLYR